MFIKDLKPGDRFLTLDARGTVYRFESARIQDGYAAVTYTLPGGTRMTYGTKPMSTVVLVDNPAERV